MANFDERFVLDEKNKDNIIYNEHIIRYELAKQLVKGKKVLDIACGSGYGAKIIAENEAQEVIGIDADEKAIAKAQSENKLKNLKYQKGDAENLNLEEESLDIITSFETIEHLQKPSEYLKELSRVIKKDGIVLLSTPNKEIYQEKNPYHYREYTKEEFEKILSGHFPNVKIIAQGNGLASFISDSKKEIKASIPAEQTALYFIAICSHSEEKIENFDFQPIGSINPQALDNIRNNPSFKMVDKIYSLLTMIPGLKQILKYFSCHSRESGNPKS